LALIPFPSLQRDIAISWLSEVVEVVEVQLLVMLLEVEEVDRLFICNDMDSLYQHTALLWVQGARKIHQDHRLHSTPLQQ
jgi:hypothetical protein